MQFLHLASFGKTALYAFLTLKKSTRKTPISERYYTNNAGSVCTLRFMVVHSNIFNQQLNFLLVVTFDFFFFILRFYFFPPTSYFSQEKLIAIFGKFLIFLKLYQGICKYNVK